jgi:hypothetical protein
VRSAAFYERYLGLKRSGAGPPHAVVFGTRPIAFAVRDVVAGTDLDAVAQPGQGMALLLHAPDAQDIAGSWRQRPAWSAHSAVVGRQRPTCAHQLEASAGRD